MTAGQILPLDAGTELQLKLLRAAQVYTEANSSTLRSHTAGLRAEELWPDLQLLLKRQTRSASNQWRTSEMSQACRICCNTRCKRGCENWQVRRVYSLCHLILETPAEIRRSNTTPRGGGKILATLQSHSLGKTGGICLNGATGWHRQRSCSWQAQSPAGGCCTASASSPGDEPPQAEAHKRESNALKITHCFS